MERDFMGLNFKEAVVKDETLEGCKEPVFSVNSAVQWPLSNGFEAFNKQQAGEFQCAHFQHDTKQGIPIIMSSPLFRPHFGGVPVNNNTQLLGGIPVTSPHFVFPSTGTFLARAPEQWYGSKAAPTPAQLTIFYSGMVNVYDGISPEKAEAIMFFAGHGGFGNAPTTPAGDAVSSPMSVSSHPVAQHTDNKYEAAAKQVMTSLGHVMQSAIPQARKASLARFLEKRKERVMASAPYYCLSKNTIDCAFVAASE